MQPLILALLCLVGIWPNTQQPTAWQEFSSTEGGFSVTMPEAPKTSVLETYTPRGRIFTYTVSSTDADLNSYQVNWTDYPQESIEQRATERLFNRMRDALVESKGAKVLSESVINQEGHPARIITMAESDGRVTKVGFYFVKNRFYQVMAETKEGDTERAERFFNSFKLLPGTLI